jgi:hypothetical protein
LLCGHPLDDYLVWLDVQQISAKPLQLIGDLNLSSQAAAPAAQAGSQRFAPPRLVSQASGRPSTSSGGGGLPAAELGG